MAEQDRSSRRPGIDVARVGALVLVVLGHLTMAVIDRGPDGEVRGANLLALAPDWAWLAVLSLMPVFFAAAGWANLDSDLRSTAARLRALVGLGGAVLGVWVLAAGLAWAVTGESGVVTDGARLATQPLWFLAAYVPLAAAAPALRRAAQRPVVSVGACLAVLVVSDLARFVGDAPRWVGWPGFFAAWTVPWILGIAWRLRIEPAERPMRTERLAGLALLSCAGAVCVLLVRTAGYSPALIDAVPGQRSNTTPPTLYTAVAATAQVGALMLGAGWLDRLGRRAQRVLARAGEASVGVYVLHLSALALCTAAIAAGLPTPERLTTGWWLSRPLWWAAVLAVTAGLVAIADLTRRRLAGRGARGGLPRPVGAHWRVIGVVATTIGAAIVGLEGPRAVATAVGSVACFALGWWGLGATDAAREDRNDQAGTAWRS